MASTSSRERSVLMTKPSLRYSRVVAAPMLTGKLPTLGSQPACGPGCSSAVILRFEGGAEKCGQVPAIHVLVGRFSGGVVATRQYHHFMVEFMTHKFVHHLARELGQKREVIVG